MSSRLCENVFIILSHLSKVYSGIQFKVGSSFLKGIRRYSAWPLGFQSCSSDSLHLTLYTLALPSPILLLSNFMMMSESFFIYWYGNLVDPFNLRTWVRMFSKFRSVIALVISSFLFSLFFLYNLLVRIWTSWIGLIFFIVLTSSLYLVCFM